MPEPTDLPEPLVRLERRDDGVATVTLANGKVNALSVATLAQLQAAATALTEEPARAVIVTGGPKLFAAGADVHEFGTLGEEGSFTISPPERVREIGRSFLDALEAVATIPCPTIAAISGFALGGGCELALACDLRIASERAKLGQPEILLGIIPGGGGTQRLARLVGPSVAKHLVFTGRQVDAAEALRIGLVDEVVPPDALDARVEELASSLARGPADALRLAKAAIDAGLDLDLAAGLRVEQERFVEVFGTGDATVGVTSFLANGPGHAEFA